MYNEEFLKRVVFPEWFTDDHCRGSVDIYNCLHYLRAPLNKHAVKSPGRPGYARRSIT